MKNALTFDIEEYFQVENFKSVIPFHTWERFESRVEASTETILTLLAEKKVKATFFVLGWIAERHPELVKTIKRESHRIASHGYAHTLVYDMRPDEFRNDSIKAREILESISGAPIISYRAPSFSIVENSLWALDILMEEGIRYDSSIFPITHHRYGIKDSSRLPYIIKHQGEKNLIEFPISTRPFLGKMFPFSGGGYARLFPYSFLKNGISYLNQQKIPAISYFHPWEFDPEQPRLKGSFLSHFRHYVHLSSTKEKLSRMLDDFAWAPMEEVLGEDRKSVV
jgi:polysaccharide deacetylase family protein (PEP-CTERM system associated)